MEILLSGFDEQIEGNLYSIDVKKVTITRMPREIRNMDR